MAEIFGHSWASQYGEAGGAAFESWSIGLQHLTPERIGQGFHKAIEDPREFPPNLSQFRVLCESKDVAPPMHQPAQIEDKHTTTPGVAEKNLAEMREILSGSNADE